MAEDLSANVGPPIVVEAWVLLSFALIILVLRLFSRKIANVGFWWDDYLVIASVLVSIVDATFATLSVVKYGLGQHIQVVGPEAAVGYIKTFLAQEFCYLTILFTAKMSILLYFWRIFNVSGLKWPIYLLGTIVNLWFLGTIITTAVQCQPLEALWYTDKGHCTNSQHTFLAYAIPNIVTDFLLILTPLPFIWKLSMRTWQKLGLSAAFALGSMVTIISIIRTVLAIAHFDGADDPTWAFVSLTKWSLAELFLAPITACLPSLGPLVRRIIRSRQPTQDVYSPPSDVNILTGRSQHGQTGTMHSGIDKNSSTVRGFERLNDDEDYNIALRDLTV